MSWQYLHLSLSLSQRLLRSGSKLLEVVMPSYSLDMIYFIRTFACTCRVFLEEEGEQEEVQGYWRNAFQ